MEDNFNPLVSIIMPCYNVAAFVENAISSVLCQTYSNMEIWIIDDASTDNTLNIIRSFSDPRIIIAEYKRNTQKMGAVNEVLQKVQGELIAFQDADDWSEPNRIEEQVREFRKDHKLGICFTNYRYRGENEHHSKRIAFTNEELRKEFFNFYKERLFESPTVCGTMMLSREALKQTGGYNPYFSGRVAEDVEWAYRVIKYFKAITIDKMLYNYRMRPGSFSQIQAAGQNAKYAYSWYLLSKIIEKDIKEGIDVFSAENSELLKELELQACEDALVEALKNLNKIMLAYKTSSSFKIGKLILKPIHVVTKLVGRRFH